MNNVNPSPSSPAPPPKAPPTGRLSPEQTGIAMARELQGFLAAMQPRGLDGQPIQYQLPLKDLCRVWALARSKKDG